MQVQCSAFRPASCRVCILYSLRDLNSQCGEDDEQYLVLIKALGLTYLARFP